MKKLKLKYLSDRKIAAWQNEIAAIYNTNIPISVMSVINVIQYSDEVEEHKLSDKIKQRVFFKTKDCLERIDKLEK